VRLQSQYLYYNFYYKNRDYVQTTMILGAIDIDSELGNVEEAVGAYALAGFNLLGLKAPTAGTSKAVGSTDGVIELAPWLNGALRQGLMVLNTLPSAAAADIHLHRDIASTISQTMSTVGCHPNFGGFSFGGPALGHIKEDASLLGRLQDTSAQLRRTASALLHPALAATPVDVVTLMTDGGAGANLPLVALEVPMGQSAQAIAAGLGSLALLLAAPHAPKGTFVVHLNMTTAAAITGGTGAGIARFGAYASLAFGGQGLLYSGVITPTIPLATDINRRLSQWGSTFQSHDIVGVLNSGSADIPGTVRLNGSSPAALKMRQLVKSIDDHLLIAFLQIPAKGTNGASPPMLFVVNQVLGEARAATIHFVDSVLGWTPMLGSCSAGFASCKKLVLGATPHALLHTLSILTIHSLGMTTLIHSFIHSLYSLYTH
jgi:hypothetical protein